MYHRISPGCVGSGTENECEEDYGRGVLGDLSRDRGEPSLPTDTPGGVTAVAGQVTPADNTAREDRSASDPYPADIDWTDGGERSLPCAKVFCSNSRRVWYVI